MKIHDILTVMIHPSDYRKAVKQFKKERSKIDHEFFPYVERLTVPGRCIPWNCCVGHMEYREGMPRLAGSDRWGYLALFVSLEAFEDLHRSGILGADWLFIPLSQLWKGDPPALEFVTQNGTPDICFAWDAKAWPRPAIEICRVLLEE